MLVGMFLNSIMNNVVEQFFTAKPDAIGNRMGNVTFFEESVDAVQGTGDVSFGESDREVKALSLCTLWNQCHRSV